MSKNTLTPEERLWSNTDRSGDCWIWLGYKYYPSKTRKRGPYGMMSAFGRGILVHRLAWMFARGPIPDGTDVHQICGDTLCINPEHLETGGFRGKKLAMTISDRRHYWNIYHTKKVTQAVLAREAGVSLSFMNRLVTGECP